jgi:hypothetical protein
MSAKYLWQFAARADVRALGACCDQRNKETRLPEEPGLPRYTDRRGTSFPAVDALRSIALQTTGLHLRTDFHRVSPAGLRGRCRKGRSIIRGATRSDGVVVETAGLDVRADLHGIAPVFEVLMWCPPRTFLIFSDGLRCSRSDSDSCRRPSRAYELSWDDS